MRLIEHRIREAWLASKPIAIDNTRVCIEGSNPFTRVVYLELFGNIIARKRCDRTIEIKVCRNSSTTRSRLRNICGARIYQKNSILYLDDQPIDVHSWHEIPQL